MKRYVAVLAIVSVLGIAGLTLAGAPAATPGRNEADARDFVRLAFERQDLRAAFDKYVAADLIEHNPEFGDGRDSIFAYIERRHADHPNEYLPVAQWRNHMDLVMFKDDMLVTKMHVFSRPNDRGRVFADFWRFKDGKIVEHWDVIQEVPPEKANPRDMW